MIFLELIIFLNFMGLFFISSVGYGHKFICIEDKSLAIKFFSGFFIIGLLITSIHFFLKINLVVSCIIFFLGLFFFFQKNNHKSIKIIEKSNLVNLLIILLLIPIYVSQKFHEDFGYYHLPYVINLFNEKIIFGLGNTNIGYVHGSIWLNILSIFYIENNFNYVNLPTFLIYVVFVVFSFNRILNSDHKKNISSNLFLIICLFYFLLKLTRISEFGNDLPALIFSVLSIFFFLKFQEENDFKKKKDIFFFSIAFTFYAIMIKLSSIPLIILPSYLFFKNFKDYKGEIFRFRYLIIYFVFLSFSVQQFIYSGCFIFPTNFTCLDVFWFNEKFLSLSKNLELINKSYNLASEIYKPDEYLKNFNWFPFWINRNFNELIEHTITMLIPISLLIILLKDDKNYKKLIFNWNRQFIIFLILGFCFWLLFSPVYRFGTIYFLSLIFIFALGIYKKKQFSKFFFSSLFALFLIFNFSKNINRLTYENDLFFGIKKIKNQSMEYDNNDKNFIKVFKPDYEKNKTKGNGWQGRLCWDINFLCSYNIIDVFNKNDYLVINEVK